MKTYTIYKNSDGSILRCITTTADNIAANIPSGYSSIEGSSHPKKHVVTSGSIVSKSDSDITAYDTLKASNVVRAERDRLLSVDIDTLNPIRWNALSSTKQTEWATYRQALLDIPDQAGFPNSVTWPTKPT